MICGGDATAHPSKQCTSHQTPKTALLQRDSAAERPFPDPLRAETILGGHTQENLVDAKPAAHAGCQFKAPEGAAVPSTGTP